MERHKKSIAIVVVFVLALSAFGIMAYAYDNEATSTLLGVTIKGRNYISDNQKSSSATSWTSSMYSDVTVNADFYWYDFDLLVFGSTNLAGGGGGSWTVSAPTLDPRRYYKVVSDHDFWVSGQHSGFSGIMIDLSPYP